MSIHVLDFIILNCKHIVLNICQNQSSDEQPPAPVQTCLPTSANLFVNFLLNSSLAVATEKVWGVCTKPLASSALFFFQNQSSTFQLHSTTPNWRGCKSQKVKIYQLPLKKLVWGGGYQRIVLRKKWPTKEELLKQS